MRPLPANDVVSSRSGGALQQARHADRQQRHETITYVYRKKASQLRAVHAQNARAYKVSAPD